MRRQYFLSLTFNKTRMPNTRFISKPDENCYKQPCSVKSALALLPLLTSGALLSRSLGSLGLLGSAFSILVIAALYVLGPWPLEMCSLSFLKAGHRSVRERPQFRT